MPHHAHSEPTDVLEMNRHQAHSLSVGLPPTGTDLKASPPVADGLCPSSPEQISLHDTEANSRDATMLEVSLHQSPEMASSLKAPPHAYGKPLAPDVVDLLPTHSDHDLAQLFGGHHSRYYRLRKKLKIPAPKPDRRKSLGSELPGQLGKVPDTTLAKQYGVSPTTISKRRAELGIGPAGVSARSRQPGSRSKSPTGEWTAELLDLLGKLKDQEVARLSGYSRPTVTQKRVSLGIAPAGRAPGIPSEAIPLLGLYSDTELARRFGGSAYRYFYHRQQRGIPAARRSRAPASGADDAQPTPDLTDGHPDAQ